MDFLGNKKSSRKEGLEILLLYFVRSIETCDEMVKNKAVSTYTKHQRHNNY